MASVRKGEGPQLAETMPPPPPAADKEVAYLIGRFEGKVEQSFAEVRKTLAHLSNEVIHLDKRMTTTSDVANAAKKKADESDHLREVTSGEMRKRFDEGMTTIRGEITSLRQNDELQNRAIQEGIKATRDQDPKIDQLLAESAERRNLSKARLEVEEAAAKVLAARKEKLELFIKIGGAGAIFVNVAAWLLTHWK